LAAFCLDDGFEQNFPRCQLNYLGSFNPTRMFLVIFFFRQKLLELLQQKSSYQQQQLLRLCLSVCQFACLDAAAKKRASFFKVS
jgi:hypothetical protein